MTAGKIDLKVDHAYAAYNGEDCTERCHVEPDAVDLITNGSFEEPIVDTNAHWNIFPESTVPGWGAEWVTTGGEGQPEEANIELHRGVNNWQAQDGEQYTELDSDWDGPSGNINNEQALIKLYQDINTVAGQKYELRYWHSYRPGTDASQNEMIVSWNGVQLDDITDADGTGKTQTSWKEYVHQVVGDGGTIRLEFDGAGPNNSFGIFLDSVSLKPMTCSQETANGGQCNLWEEPKDLGKGDFFWNFSDIKPGDQGRDVISLHVDDNDAWACILADNVVDAENDRIQPEVDAGDTTDDPGELSKYIYVFAWQDDNHNGVFEPGSGELPLTSGPEKLFNPAGYITVADSTSGTPIAGGSETRYVGLSWCVGDMANPGEASMTCDGSVVGNDAQTDTMTADIVNYAEQWRNNPNFRCSDVVLNK